MARGIFTIGFTEAEVLQILGVAKAQFLAGEKIMQWTDSGVNVQKQEPMRPADVLEECQYALRQINPTTYGRKRRLLRTRISCSQP